LENLLEEEIKEGDQLEEDKDQDKMDMEEGMEDKLLMEDKLVVVASLFLGNNVQLK